MNVKFINNPDHLPENTPPSVVEEIKKVSDTYQFRTNSYYNETVEKLKLGFFKAPLKALIPKNQSSH